MTDFVGHGKTTCKMGPNDEVELEIHGSLMPTEIDIQKDRYASGAVLKVLLNYPRKAFKHPDELFTPEGKMKLGTVLAEAYYQMVMDAYRSAPPNAHEPKTAEAEGG